MSSKGKTGCCSARVVLWYLSLSGFAVNYMIRLNLNIAIVSMIEPPQNVNNTLKHFNSNASFSVENSTQIFEQAPEMNPETRTFRWNAKEQSRILGSFFWLHWITQIPGGILGAKFGPKIVFGFANFGGVLCLFFIPAAATMGKNYLIALRVLQGFVAGFAWPAMQSMTARWIPPDERSKFLTAFLGSSIGAALTYPICGIISHHFGWESVFYVCGVFGTVWFCCWWLMVYDSPSQHPRISTEERDYILESLGNTSSRKIAPVPWKQLLTSGYVWLNCLAQLGGCWGLFTLMTHSPTYFRFIHGMSISKTGLLTGLGHIIRTFWSFIFGQVADYLIRSKKLSRTNTRRWATASCTIGQGVFMLALAFYGENYVLAVLFLSLAVAMNGSVSAGPIAAMVDLSPNYASIIMGIVNTVVAFVGFLTPMVVGHLTYQNQTIEQWQKVFWISSAMLFTSGIIYCTFAKADLQPWNSPDTNKKDTELMSIKLSEKELEAEFNRNGYSKVAINSENT